MAEMYVGTMHGYALDLLQRLVPETFKFSVLTDITSRLLVDRNSRKSGLTDCPTTLARHADASALHPLEALPAGDQRPPRGHRRLGSRPGRSAESSFSDYMKLLYEQRVLRLHRDDQPRRSVPRG